jgi:hypothetical protein
MQTHSAVILYPLATKPIRRGSDFHNACGKLASSPKAALENRRRRGPSCNDRGPLRSNREVIIPQRGSREAASHLEQNADAFCCGSMFAQASKSLILVTPCGYYTTPKPVLHTVYKNPPTNGKSSPPAGKSLKYAESEFGLTAYEQGKNHKKYSPCSTFTQGGRFIVYNKMHSRQQRLQALAKPKTGMGGVPLTAGSKSGPRYPPPPEAHAFRPRARAPKAAAI